MKKLNLYIVKQIIVGFLLVTFSLMSIIWLTQSLRFVELITNKGLPVSIFVKMTSLLMPRIFIILSPISLFVSTLFVYNRMIADRELSVMMAAGISPWQCAKPAFYIGIFMTLFCIYTNNIGIPAAEKAFNELEWQVKNDVSHLMFREGEFTTMQNNLTVFITTHEKDGSISGILVNDERNPKTKVTLSAEKGRIVYTEKGPRIIMINGVRQEINRTNAQFSSLSFDRYSVDFGTVGSKKAKETGAREKSLWELLTAKNDTSLTPKEVNRYIVEGCRRILTPLYNLLFALVACTGLLVGNFNRRGQTKLISVSIVAMVLIQAGDLAFGNISVKNLYFLPLLFINFFIPLTICFYMLLFYNPAAQRKKHKGLESNE
ncbi:MAG: LptF/LptG family permease [Alphaproteobacteria bacterium]|nr:LptF/LptG family permease [Alphaproteobacteria bacterium]